MSASTKIQIPRSENQQLQLQIALHAGPCSARVIGLQTASGISQIPHYKLFGPSLQYTHNLCMTGLDVQIQISNELLTATGSFDFERSRLHHAVHQGTYWLVDREGMDLKLPTLDYVLPCTDYDDTANINRVNTFVLVVLLWHKSFQLN